MNKKAFSLAIILSMATTGAFASDVVSTSVNNGDKLTKLQKEAIQLTQQQLAQKASQDAQQYEVALNLNEDSTVSLALANNRTAKQSLWDYQAAKATVSATAAGKNPNVSYAWQGARNHGANTMTGRTVTSKTGQHSFTIKAPVFSPELDANIDKSRFAREGSGAAYEEALQQAKYDAINGYYTLIMYRNKVDVANQAVKDYQGHVDNVKAQYNVGLVANSDVLAADTNLADSQTNLVKAQNAANLAEANLNLVIAYPTQTSITTAEHDLQYKPYAVTLEQAKAYAMLHRSALVQSAMAVKQAEEGLKAEKAGYLPTVGVEAGRGYADPDGYFGTSSKSWHIGASATWSLWDGGQTQNKIKVAQDTLEKAKEAFAKINELRKAQGLKELTWSDDVYNSLALPKANQISRQYDSTGFVARREEDPATVATKWFNSGLRELLLDPNVTEGAVAAVVNGDGYYYWAYNYK